MTPATDAEPGVAAPFVAVSVLSVPEASRAALLAAFTQRLRLVDAWPGFQQLRVWADPTDRKFRRYEVIDR
jgi:heme-degrading monooxygenase HmoA